MYLELCIICGQSLFSYAKANNIDKMVILKILVIYADNIM